MQNLGYGSVIGMVHNGQLEMNSITVISTQRCDKEDWEPRFSGNPHGTLSAAQCSALQAIRKMPNKAKIKIRVLGGQPHTIDSIFSYTSFAGSCN